MSTPLLSVDLSAHYPQRPRVLDSVRFSLAPGEAVGVVGESGAGKSTLSLALLGLLPLRGGTAAGSVRLDGRELLPLSEREWRTIRGRQIALSLQSAGTALNPWLRLGTQLREAWRAHQRDDAAGEERIRTLLAGMDLPADPAWLRRYPGEISLGQAQRVLLALALLHRPRLLVADEPTSALDALTRREVEAVLAEQCRAQGATLLLITHDLYLVLSLCARMMVLRSGTIVEQGPVREVWANPQHPYTQALIAATQLHNSSR